MTTNDLLTARIQKLPSTPGVYQMLDKKEQIIYVGKARNLKKRVKSYFHRKHADSPKTALMMRQVTDLQIIATETEADALVLESNLIKKNKPRYNILFRDDKSYPYLFLSAHPYPRISAYRGARKLPGRYFGPYPDATAVRYTLRLVQKLFSLRPCHDNFFNNRTRPCLQYQIKRCSGPCVGKISEKHYQSDVRRATLFLEGKNEEVLDALREPMQQASEQLDFEKAAWYRDQIRALRRVQEQHNVAGERDVDVIACAMDEETVCVQVFFIRNGINLGTRAYFPKCSGGHTPPQIMSAFLSQFYLSTSREEAIPSGIVLSVLPCDQLPLLQALRQKAGSKVVFYRRIKERNWLAMAKENAALSLKNRLGEAARGVMRFTALERLLNWSKPIKTIICFDISHTDGKDTVASSVAFTREGSDKDNYRRFNINGITPGDDYAAMQHAVSRHFTTLLKEERLPEVLLIDGGSGQVKVAREVLCTMQIDTVQIIGVAKGQGRKSGTETLILSGTQEKKLRPAENNPAFHLIQQIRDEAHRFAITGHRRKRSKRLFRSPLLEIPGIGKKRRSALISYFGGLSEIKQAGVEDLAKVGGVSQNLAHKIYQACHNDNVHHS